VSDVDGQRIAAGTAVLLALAFLAEETAPVLG
jgi:hypothetical protein